MGGGILACACATLTSVIVVGGCASLRNSGALPVSRMEQEEFSFCRCLHFGLKYIPISWQQFLERLMEEIGLVGVLGDSMSTMCSLWDGESSECARRHIVLCRRCVLRVGL